MGILTDKDREFLARACSSAEGARRPPERLGNRPEPTWTALLATEDRELGLELFQPGDSEDAVAKLIGKLGAGAGAGATLYLTVEPKASFDRLPPVTESVRRLGARRVVIGTLDPAPRYRREGVGTLERMGVDVVLADGEEARRCQTILDDYAKCLQRGLAVLRARVEFRSAADGDVDLGFASRPELPRSVDAVICSPGAAPVIPGQVWRVVLDSEGWEEPKERTLVYRSAGGPAVRGTRAIPYREGKPDLGALLRDLASLGLFSVEICGDPGLVRQAVRVGLVDGMIVQLAEDSESARALARAHHVRLTQGGDTIELKLDGARFCDGQNRCLEARVVLC